ncbi:hypothetical protein [Rhizohabitans arisaemae]|uniref:hypothetical protein n=1 Tax=Rhizohabitans arisaemae TaxID=2720610 RepID=UPI0024B0455F|nr:hypothetical protein [Rhizohabitans arisaemae]
MQTLTRRLTALALSLSLPLTACAAADRPRPLTEAEITRLSAMRLGNRTDQVAAVFAQVRAGDSVDEVRGWVDWRQRLLYLAVDGADPRLMQMVPGLVAVRRGAVKGAPPLPAPQDRWRVHRLSPAPGQFAEAVERLGLVLLSLAADRPENPVLLRRAGAAWLRSDRVGPVEVDVFRGPAAPGRIPDTPTTVPYHVAAPTSLGTIRYWVDHGARLRRAELLSGTVVDFDRTTQARLTPVAAIRPR